MGPEPVGLWFPTQPRKLRLIEASENRIGKLADAVTLLCYQYDPMTGKYGFAITTTLRAAGVLTILALGGFIAIKLIRERRASQQPAGNFPRGDVGSHEGDRAGRCPRAIKV